MIADALSRQGNWLFRWRGHVPLVLFPLACLTISQPEPIELYFGELADDLYELCCLLIAFVGFGLRCLCVGFVPAGTSGRNTRAQAAEALNTTGLYSLTRNPLYFGNAITYMAAALFTQGLQFSILMLLFLVIYFERIIAAEERFLAVKFGQAYEVWAREVPTFFPKLRDWKRPPLAYSLKTVLRREYTSLFVVIVTFVAIDYSRDIFSEGETRLDPELLTALITGAVIYIALRSLKKYTRLLHVEGR